MYKIIFMAVLFCGGLAFAHPKKMANIRGKNIHLQTVNHTFAGSINGHVVSGYKKQGLFESELSVFENDTKLISNFKHNNQKVFGGTLVLSGVEKSEHHQIEFVELVREEDIFVFKFDGEIFKIYVTADRFENGHYINPEYSLNYRGEKVSFKLNGGQACYGYSAHLISMIFPVAIFSRR